MDHHQGCTCDQCLLVYIRSTDPAERQQGWESWYLRDSAAVRTYIERRCVALGCLDQSEDILQDCFLIGFRNASNGRYCERSAPLRHYLFGIAKRLILDVVRSQRQRPYALTGLEADEDATMRTIDDVYQQEIIGCVWEAYTCLSHVERRVLEGVYLEYRSSHQVAKEIGKAAGSVRSIAYRAIRQVSEYVENQHDMCLSAEAVRACLAVLANMQEMGEQVTCSGRIS